MVAEGLDHPESLVFGPDGSLYAGGEAGQVYRIDADTGRWNQIARTDGFHLGLAVDGDGTVYVCDMKAAAVRSVSPSGESRTISKGIPQRPMQVPNACVFDREGNLYVSDSGEYWSQAGTGCIFVIRPNCTTELFHAGPLRFPNGLAIDPSHQYLYVIESTGPRVVRIRLDGLPASDTEPETVLLMEACVPDGLTFACSGMLYIGCYKPDAIYGFHPEQGLEVVMDDPTGELLSRPTNLALRGGELFFANLGGWHIGAIAIDQEPAPTYHPRLRELQS